MKTYTVCVPADYIVGHVRYGHAEYKIQAESADEAIEKLRTTKETIRKMNKGEIPDDPDFEDIDYSNIVIDDACIDDIGEYNYNDMWVEE